MEKETKKAKVPKIHESLNVNLLRLFCFIFSKSFHEIIKVDCGAECLPLISIPLLYPSGKKEMELGCGFLA